MLDFIARLSTLQTSIQQATEIRGLLNTFAIQLEEYDPRLKDIKETLLLLNEKISQILVK